MHDRTEGLKIPLFLKLDSDYLDHEQKAPEGFFHREVQAHVLVSKDPFDVALTSHKLNLSGELFMALEYLAICSWGATVHLGIQQDYEHRARSNSSRIKRTWAPSIGDCRRTR